MKTTYRPFEYERVYLPLFKVSETPFHIQRDDMFISHASLTLSLAAKLLIKYMILTYFTKSIKCNLYTQSAGIWMLITSLKHIWDMIVHLN